LDGTRTHDSFKDVKGGRATIYVGSQNNNTGEFFNGQLDEVRIYDAVLTAGEIAALAQ